MPNSKLVMTATVVLFAAAFSYTGAASAQPLQASPSPAASSDSTSAPSFGELDKANRGYLTRSDIPKDVESLKSLRAHFDEADTDKNGRLSKSEYAAYVATLSRPTMSGAGG